MDRRQAQPPRPLWGTAEKEHPYLEVPGLSVRLQSPPIICVGPSSGVVHGLLANDSFLRREPGDGHVETEVPRREKKKTLFTVIAEATLSKCTDASLCLPVSVCFTSCLTASLTTTESECFGAIDLLGRMTHPERDRQRIRTTTAANVHIGRDATS